MPCNTDQIKPLGHCNIIGKCTVEVHINYNDCNYILAPCIICLHAIFLLIACN